jgi:ABC-type multidrug transport system permease subunit
MLGFATIFSNDNQTLYKVGVVGMGEHQFLESRYIEFIHFDNLPKAITKVERHQLDLLLQLDDKNAYWINSTSPKGYLVEQILIASGGKPLNKQAVTGDEIRYIDWLVPGVLAMNMMFSALFGIGFVVVRYRKNGVLKRFRATPISTLEFITAQIVSRLAMIMVTAVGVYIVCDLILDFAMFGSYLALLIVMTVGAFSLICMGLLISARISSDELAGGLVNIISIPMMLLSGVWFSLEGSPDFLLAIAQLLPLTHMLEAARAIMIDGAGLLEISGNLFALLIMSGIYLIIGALMFKWD